jgi:Ser/Thr protein kinase RdoA (MazF antagonist)
MNQKSAWGDEKTSFFFELTPDRVMSAVEEGGILCTGRCMTLNSMENRVYDIEVEQDEAEHEGSVAWDAFQGALRKNFRVVKFYRPGRWTEEQILEEHRFLLELLESEVPVVAPLAFSDGSTLKRESKSGIWFSIFPRVGGRAPDELSKEQLERVGRLLARIHNVGSVREAPSRIALTPENYGIRHLQFLKESKAFPLEIESRYAKLVEAICKISEPWFQVANTQRIHGDCHLGNLLWSPEGPFFLDFDDMVQGPPIQDLWLLLQGRDQEAKAQLQHLLSGYEQMREFDDQSLRLIEPLRALRMIHFNAWISRRWEDPAFPQAFPQYGSGKYWEDEVRSLEEILHTIESSDWSWM